MIRTVSIMRKYFDEREPDEELDGGVTYLSGRDVLVIDTALAGKLGNPDEITVTIEPGDTLNPIE